SYAKSYINLSYFPAVHRYYKSSAHIVLLIVPSHSSHNDHQSAVHTHVMFAQVESVILEHEEHSINDDRRLDILLDHHVWFLISLIKIAFASEILFYK